MPLASDSDALVKAIMAKDWSSLEAIEANGELLFKETIARKRSDGTWEHIPVLLKVLRENERRKCRVVARSWAEEENIDPTIDESYFENMDAIVQLSKALIDPNDPNFGPYEPFYKELEKRFDHPVLTAMWAKMDAYSKVIDPRPQDLEESEFIAMVASIAESRSIVPLVAFGGALQDKFVITMAERLAKLQISKS